MKNNVFKNISISLISVWLCLLALFPFSLVLIASFLQQGDTHFFQWHFTLQHYRDFFSIVYFHIFTRSVVLASMATFFCLCMGYPFAYILARIAKPNRHVFLLLIIIPFWTSSLIRTYAIIAIIQANGLLNKLLMYFGIIHQPLHLLYTSTASMIGLVYALLPYMILPIYANMEKFDWHLLEAAEDLGATRLQAFFKILLPLTFPGILSGVLLVLLPAMTLFYIPDILGGAKSTLLGNLIRDQFLGVHNWPMGSAISVILTAIMLVLVFIYKRFNVVRRQRRLW